MEKVCDGVLGKSLQYGYWNGIFVRLMGLHYIIFKIEMHFVFSKFDQF
jgi:hypothetical protein